MRITHECWQTWKGSEWGGHVQLPRFLTAQQTPIRTSRTEIQPGLVSQAVPLAWATCQVEGAPSVNLHKRAPCRAGSAQWGHLFLGFPNCHKCSLWSLEQFQCLEQKALHQKTKFCSADWLVAQGDAQSCPTGSRCWPDHVRKGFPLVTQCHNPHPGTQARSNQPF